MQIEDTATQGKLTVLGITCVAGDYIKSNYPVSILECTDTDVYFMAIDGIVYKVEIGTYVTTSIIPSLENFRTIAFSNQWPVEAYENLRMNLVKYTATTSYPNATTWSAS